MRYCFSSYNTEKLHYINNVNNSDILLCIEVGIYSRLLNELVFLNRIPEYQDHHYYVFYEDGRRFRII